MNPISGLDAAFLYAETPTSPMHVGSVAIIEGSLEFDTFKKIILSRIHQVPRLRQKLLYVPFSIDYPYWVDDPYFDIDLHLNHIALPQPGSWKELRAIASKIFSEPLDRSRPLWSFTFVEGLEGIKQVPKGSVAMISKIHHVAIDGVAGAGMLSLLFDMTKKIKPIPEPKPYNPEALPDDFSLIVKSTMSFASKPLKLPRILMEGIKATVKTGFMTRAQHLDLPTAPFTAPRSPLNGIISQRRKWNTEILSLERIKALKNIMGTTLNDVILAICSGALRRYLDEKEKLPVKSLVAMVPISTRAEGEKNATGNQISSMLVQIATHVADPIERLEVIHENTVRGKTYQGAMGAKTLANMAEAVPFGLANQAAQIYSRFHLAKLHNPVFNVTITNVPGPQFPLYVNGHKLHSIMGAAPIIDGMGLIISIFSYDGNVTISSTSDAKTMPDLNTFSRYIRESANELEELILALDKDAQKKEAKAKQASADSDAMFEHIQTYFTANPKFLRPNSGMYQFQITGPVPAEWHLNLNDAPGSATRGKVEKPDVILTIKDDHLMRIARGELNLQMAFIQGRINVKGDNKMAMKLNAILSKIPNLE